MISLYNFHSNQLNLFGTQVVFVQQLEVFYKVTEGLPEKNQFFLSKFEFCFKLLPVFLAGLSK